MLELKSDLGFRVQSVSLLWGIAGVEVLNLKEDKAQSPSPSLPISCAFLEAPNPKPYLTARFVVRLSLRI